MWLQEKRQREKIGQTNKEAVALFELDVVFVSEQGSRVVNFLQNVTDGFFLIYCLSA